MKLYDSFIDRDGRPYLNAVGEVLYEGSIETVEEMQSLARDILHMGDYAEEHVFLLATDTRGKPLGAFEVGRGDVSTALIDKRGIFTRALLIGAVNVVLIHNHPSGDVTPSDRDRDVAKDMEEGCRLLGLHLLDFLIVTKENYFSFTSERLIKRTGVAA